MQTRTPSTAGPKVGDPVRVETIQRALEMAELDAVVCTLPQHAAEAYQYLPNSLKVFKSREELADSMRRAGLEEVRWYDLSGGSVAVHVGTKPGAL